MKSELDREVWSRIAAIFDRALDVDPRERAVFLATVAGSDATVREEVAAMLEAHDRDEGLLAERRLDGAERLGADLTDELPSGARIGPYRVDRLVGAGGMGDVYRAERADGSYRQTVAIKVLRPGYRTAEMVRRFRIEREALARLVHPGIATLLDGGALEDGRPYLVLQFVDGVPITAYCADHALSVGDRLAIFLEVTRAVQFAHGHLIIHRDIKPSNLLVQCDGTPRLLDFGIAKLLDSTGDASLALDTTPDVRLLTPEYAAPEQLRGEAPSTATDVYALGVLLFELLTGSKPFSSLAGNRAELEKAILELAPPAPSAVVSARTDARAIRGDLDRIVLKALRKEPDRRYASAGQFGEDIERYREGRPVLARPDSVRYRVTRFATRNRGLVAAGIGFVALLAGFAVVMGLQARRIGRERDRAERERASAEEVVKILTGIFERTDPNKHAGGDTLRVTALLDDAEREVDGLKENPRRQAALWRVVGRMRFARGEYQRALDLATRSFNRQRELAGPDDLEAARTHHEIAEILTTYRGEAAARPMLDSSLAELRRLLGDDHEDVRSALGDLLLVTADSNARRALLAELVRFERKSPSTDSFVIAGRLNREGALRHESRRFDEAAFLFDGSLRMLEARLPRDHQAVRTVRSNLAMALVEEHQFARAESLQRVAVAIEDRLESTGAGAGVAREALAVTLVKEGRADLAEPLEREAYLRFQLALVPTHWRVWSAARNLGFIASARGRVEAGLALLDSAIAIAAADSNEAANAVGYLTVQRVPFLLRLKRTAEAAASVAKGEQLLGTSSKVTRAHRADVHRYAGTMAVATGDWARSVERFRAAVALTTVPSRPGSGLGVNACLLGVGLAGLGRIAEASPLLEAPCTAYVGEGIPDPLVVEWITVARARKAYPNPAAKDANDSR